MSTDTVMVMGYSADGNIHGGAHGPELKQEVLFVVGLEVGLVEPALFPEG